MRDWLILFVLLLVFNFYHAPLQREGFFAITARPLLGLWIVAFMTQAAYDLRDLRPLWTVTIGMAAVLIGLALTATDWLPEKSVAFWGIIERLPQFDYLQAAQAFEGQVCAAPLTWIIETRCFNPAEILRLSFLSFNPNEIAGALAWVTPLLLGLAIAPASPGRGWHVLRWSAGLIGALGLLALLLGQSRFAIFGTLGSLVILMSLWRVGGRLRYLFWGVIVLLVVLQVALLTNFGSPANDSGLSERDQRSVSMRVELWESGLKMMRDYPLTGIGMGMYRVAASREPYIIPEYAAQNRTPPHAHNEWVQMGADLGVPGFVLYLIWQAVILRMLWRGWRSSHQGARIMAAAVFAGLLAHSFYGLGDAITLWDRYSFVLWWLIGLAAAQWVIVQHADDSQTMEGAHNG